VIIDASAMGDSSNFILEQSLLDILLVGWHFTWMNSWELLTWSRIHRFLLSSEWKQHFPDVSQRRLPSILSDHFPLMMD
jgi:endonuclease/exonuclease/phosphatase family metal-dependent hydrolase